MSTFLAALPRLNCKYDYFFLIEWLEIDFDWKLRSTLLLFFAITDSSVCVGPNAFANIKQGFNSTLRMTFLFPADERTSSISFNANALINLEQMWNSIMQIYVLNANNLKLENVRIKSRLIVDWWFLFFANEFLLMKCIYLGGFY